MFFFKKIIFVTILLSLFIHADTFKSNTPLEKIYQKKFGKNITPYLRYSTHLSQKYGSAYVKSVFKEKNRITTLSESLLKGFFNYYHKEDKSNSMKTLSKVYDRAFDNVKNSMSGLILQDVYIKEGNLNKASSLIDLEYCYSLKYKVDKNACLFNALYLLKKSNKDYFMLSKELIKTNKDLVFEIIDIN